MEEDSARRKEQREAQADADAGRLDFNEEDRPEYTEGYEVRSDDNQGLKPGGVEYISEDRPTSVTPLTFEDVFSGVKKVGGVIKDTFGAILNYDGPSPISVDPLGQDSVEYDYTTRNVDGTYSVKPKVWSPGDQKYVVQTPEINSNPNIATVTPADVSDKNSFKEQLKMSESSNNYSSVNSEGFKGAYQFGDDRLKDFKNSSGKNFTTKQFLKNPKLQDEVFEWHVNDIRQTIVETGTNEYIGKTIKGIPVTMKGLIAVAHLGGKQGMIDFVKSNGQKDKQDSNGTKMSTYLRRFSS